MKIGMLFTLALAAVWGITPAEAQEEADSGRWPSLKLEKVAGGLSDITTIWHAGDGSGRLFVLEQEGRIRILRDGALVKTPFLDISDRLVSGGERGLLGLAFSPDFPRSGAFYVNYTRKGDGATVVSRFRVSEGSGTAEADSETILLTVSQPFSNHNGGQIAFGPDGYLYVGLGDGGAGGDPRGHGQDSGTLLGTLLRLDVSGEGTAYKIPSDNPFVGNAETRDEIWAIGLRNPWRFSFDRRTGDLYIADVGQEKWEEIDVQPASSKGGENYGWNILEGPDCFQPPKDCEPPRHYAAPVESYGHDQGCSLTGGYVYRGPDNPAMQGIYFYGDYCSGRIWGLRRAGEKWESKALTDTDLAISTFGEDEEGRLYVADHKKGEVYRIVEEGGAGR